jgi:phospholipid/cholesterol/gamma-HCH transport system substrate-binding protein
MYLTKRIRIQLAIFAAVAVVASAVLLFGYIKLPAMFGVGRYTVTVELPRAAGLYPSGNVTYRGTEVGRITGVHLTDTGAAAVLSLRSGIAIPSDLNVEVHSVSSIGEQYLGLSPRNGTSAPLKNGDVIPVNRASVPPDINSLVEAANRGLQAIPRDNLKTVIDESYTAVGGLGPELSRIVHGSTALAIDARANLDALTALVDQSSPVLNTQTQTSDAISAWAAHLATVTGELADHNAAVTGLLTAGGGATAEARDLLDRLQPTVPILLANLVNVAETAIVYQPNIEQLLVLVPQVVQEYQGGILSSHNTKQAYRGAYLDFNLNVNLPPPCETGYLPPQQRRSTALQDYPDPPEGDLYCRVPQDSNLVAVRGARNTPCPGNPAKRAPTVAVCRSTQQYVPLNDGTNWKGDPNATISGQSVPQPPSMQAPIAGPPRTAAAPAPPLPVAHYDPATGTYVGPDGKVYTQTDLARDPKEHTWQSMLIPPGP